MKWRVLQTSINGGFGSIFLEPNGSELTGKSGVVQISFDTTKGGNENYMKWQIAKKIAREGKVLEAEELLKLLSVAYNAK